MSDPVRFQGVVRAAAADLIARVVEHADRNGWGVAAVVVDPNGHVIASGRMDGVPAPVIDFATDKARTAILGKATPEFRARRLSSRDLEIGMVNRPALCAWDGGVPIRANGNLIGALGVSGAAGPEDMDCAETALASLSLGSRGWALRAPIPTGDTAQN